MDGRGTRVLGRPAPIVLDFGCTRSAVHRVAAGFVFYVVTSTNVIPTLTGKACFCYRGVSW